MKVAIVAGGTGGHIYPGIAVGREIKKRSSKNMVFFIGSQKGLEGKLIDPKEFRLEFASGLLRAFVLLLREKPAVLISFGGYTSFSAVVSAKLLNIPIIIHEQNILPGKTNRILSRFARKVALSFEPSLNYLHGTVTGNPVRQEILSLKKEASGKNTVLVLGGSQGARSINTQILNCLDRFKDKNIEIIHLIGKRDYESATADKDFSSYPFYKPVSYMYNIEDAYKRARLVVSRAGATAISEILAVSLPSILVPYPYAADAHQDKNARYVAAAGAGVVLADDKLNDLADLIIELVRNNEGKLDKMSRAASFLAKRDATQKIVDIVEKEIA